MKTLQNIITSTFGLLTCICFLAVIVMSFQTPTGNAIAPHTNLMFAYLICGILVCIMFLIGLRCIKQ